MKKVLRAGCCLMAVLALAGCSNSAVGSGSSGNGKELVVGVRTDLSRFSYYYEESDRYLGFEDDLAEKLAEKLGYSGVEFVGLKADEREDALSSGQVDCLIATFSKTADRDEKFDLSDPYYTDYEHVIVESSTLFYEWSDLEGKKVGYLTGSNSKDDFLDKLVQEGYAADSEKAESFCTLVPMDSYAEIISSMEVGTLDGGCMDGSIALGLMCDDMIFLADETYSEEQYCVATTKGSDLSSQIDDAMEELTSDGTINELGVKWGLMYDSEEEEGETE